MVAVVIAAGPLLIAVSLVNQNASGAHISEDRIMARFVLTDLLNVLLGADLARLRQIRDDDRELARMIESRIETLPVFVKKAYQDRVLPYARGARLSLDEDLGVDVLGLARLSLSIQLQTGPSGTIRVSQLFRPAARMLPQSLQ